MRSGYNGGWRCTNALRCDVVRPGKNERDRKTQKQKGDHQTQRPVWQFPGRKCGRGQLYHASRGNNISRRDAVNLAPFHFLEEAAAHNRDLDRSGV